MFSIICGAFFSSLVRSPLISIDLYFVANKNIQIKREQKKKSECANCVDFLKNALKRFRLGFRLFHARSQIKRIDYEVEHRVREPQLCCTVIIEDVDDAIDFK